MKDNMSRNTLTLGFKKNKKDEDSKISNTGLEMLVERQRLIKEAQAKKLAEQKAAATRKDFSKKSEDKKEKESIMLDLGIPLTSSMIFSYVGGLKNISGVASMLTGLAVGSATSLGVKLIQSLKGNKEQQNSTTV